ncbi:auxin-responsive protein IAA1-like isoform X1 [Syzygium oleosum]|uniref:auxin-responsive protein IAA1-like isoform X1 n=1 Tax=Syzygium oleosum TaxID=219896 RepID=UPI0011D20E51|nr:auxin-responsive protein IAA1-like isoform X1 [Syzygium oleosum]
MLSSTEAADGSSGSDVTCMDTELTLGLPRDGGSKVAIAGAKRAYAGTVGLGLRSSIGKRSGDIEVDAAESCAASQVSGAGKVPGSKAQVVGWPPVRSFRKKTLEICKYVKVAVDGAPYLRKVDLQTYNSYDELLRALEGMFDCFTANGNYLEDSKVMDSAKGMEYVPTYEDNDGDWMLVGDVPWKMFAESCKRIRLMKGSDAAWFAPRTPKCRG